MKKIVLACLALIAGCAGTPSTPYEIARACTRNEVSVRGDVRGNSHDYREEVQTVCVDDDAHREMARSEYRLADGQVTDTAQYDTVSGANGSQVETQTSYGKKGFQYEEKVKKETSSFRWGYDIKVSTSH